MTAADAKTLADRSADLMARNRELEAAYVALIPLGTRVRWRNGVYTVRMHDVFAARVGLVRCGQGVAAATHPFVPLSELEFDPPTVPDAAPTTTAAA